jgi:hypothetical protein
MNFPSSLKKLLVWNPMGWTISVHLQEVEIELLLTTSARQEELLRNLPIESFSGVQSDFAINRTCSFHSKVTVVHFANTSSALMEPKGSLS